MDVILVLIGLVLGLGAGFFYSERLRSDLLEARRVHDDYVAETLETQSMLRVELARAQASVADDAQVADTFRAASSQALAFQSQQLVQLAEAKYATLQDRTDAAITGHSRAVEAGLRRLTDRLDVLERERTTDGTRLQAMINELTSATAATRQETAKLASAMRDNRVRGVWGEVQLRRALELAGLDRHVDFIEQRGVSNSNASGRPDVVIQLPGGRAVVIDSKVPLDRYLEAVDADDPTIERTLMTEHAKAVALHAKTLSSRDYTALVDGSIDLVLMFLPGEPFLSAALDADPRLFESAVARGVYLVTPSSLIPLLRGVALGWREQTAGEAAAEIHRLGTELHERIAVFSDRYAKVGKALEHAVEAYNASVGSLDRRVMSTARKLSEYGASSSREPATAGLVEVLPRAIQGAGTIERTLGDEAVNESG